MLFDSFHGHRQTRPWKSSLGAGSVVVVVAVVQRAAFFHIVWAVGGSGGLSHTHVKKPDPTTSIASPPHRFRCDAAGLGEVLSESARSSPSTVSTRPYTANSSPITERRSTARPIRSASQARNLGLWLKLFRHSLHHHMM